LNTSSSFRPFGFTIAFALGDAIRMAHPRGEFRRVIADVAKALDDDALAVEAA
jgi:hypothetical protein